MPSTATITAFYSFTANTKARATQVNNNFDVFRGHIIAVDPNTATAAATNTYDLGSTERRWRTPYVASIDFLGATTTAQQRLRGDTASSVQALVAEFGGVESGRIAAYTGFTTAAGKGQFARSAGIASYTWSTSTTQQLTGSTLTIDCTGNRPITIEICSADNTSAASGAFFSTLSNDLAYQIFLQLVIDGVTSGSWTFTSSLGLTSTAATGIGFQTPVNIKKIYWPSAGVKTMHLEGRGGTENLQTQLLNIAMFAKEQI
jgi:hypothetical protein